MKPLEQPDSAHIEAAQGWLDLGNHIEADQELDRIAAPNRAHPDVLQVRWNIHAKAEKWDACLQIATSLAEAFPDRRFGWLHPAVAFDKLGRLTDARETLLIALDRLGPSSTFAFYLACFCARQGTCPRRRTGSAKPSTGLKTGIPWNGCDCECSMNRRWNQSGNRSKTTRRNCELR